MILEIAATENTEAKTILTKQSNRRRHQYTLLIGIMVLVLSSCSTNNRLIRLPSTHSCILPAEPFETPANAELRQTLEHYSVVIDAERTVEVTHRHDGLPLYFEYYVKSISTGEEIEVTDERDILLLAQAIFSPFLVAGGATVDAYNWKCNTDSWTFSDMEADWEVSAECIPAGLLHSSYSMHLDTKRHFILVSNY